MSMVLNLEIEKGADIKDVESVLSNFKGADIEWEGSSLIAYIPSSNLNILFKQGLNDLVLAEDSGDASWKVGLKGYFDIDATSDNALSDVRDIVVKLSEALRFEFVLSFQYESTYARKSADKLFIDKDLMR